MPIQSTAHNTIGLSAPTNTIPRARKPRSQLLVTGSYASHDPIGGVTSISNVATRKADEFVLPSVPSAPGERRPETRARQISKRVSMETAYAKDRKIEARPKPG